MFFPLIALSIFGGALAQVPSLGACPQVQTVSKFDVTKFSGRWYEAEKFFAIFEAMGKCITADYTAGQDGVVKVVNSQKSIITGSKSSIDGTAHIPDPSQPGKLKVRLNVGFFSPESDYWVLGTDYENYAVVYSCVNLHLVNFQFAWILTRERNAPESVLQEARTVAANNHLDTSRFMKTDQQDCEIKS